MEAHKPRGAGSDTVRSVRVSAEVWEAARQRAYAEKITLSYVLRVLLDGYSKGLLDLPTITAKYTPIRPESDEPDEGDRNHQDAL